MGTPLPMLSENDHDKILEIYDDFDSECRSKKIAKSQKDLVKCIIEKLKMSENAVISALDYLGLHISEVSREMKYDISPQYNTKHLDSNYNPERYRMVSNMESCINDSISEFVILNPGLSFLNDISLSTICKGCNVKDVNDVQYQVLDKKGDILVLKGAAGKKEMNIYDIRPIVDVAAKLNLESISKLYMFIRERMDKMLFNDIDYFDIFTEYFKLSPGTTYEALPINIKTELLNKLNEASHIFKEKHSNLGIW